MCMENKMEVEMEHLNSTPGGHSGLFMNCISIVFCFIALSSLQTWVGIITIGASVSTIWLNVSRWLKEKNKK